MVDVTICCLAKEALDILRERRDGFDIVISDVNMPDMDGFKLLEYVGLEMDLPVIMMSVDGETSRVMKGIQHGACDYLLKPIRMKELKNIWQHVVRKKKNELKDIQGLKGIENIQVARGGISDGSDDGYFFCARNMDFGKKRKGYESKYHDNEIVDLSAVKKSRVVWTVELHQKFVKTVNHIGLDKIGPKKILDLMNVPWLTRENVASHLQKYRLYLSRLQKEDDLKTSFSGTKQSDLSIKEQVAADIGSRKISFKKFEADSCRYGFPDSSVIQNTPSQNHEAESGGIISLPMLMTTDDNFEIQNTSSISEGNLIHTCGAPAANYMASSSFVQSQYSLSRHGPGFETKQERRPHLEAKNDLSHLQYPNVQNQTLPNIVQFAPTIYQTPITEIDNPPHIEFKIPYSNRNLPKQSPERVEYELCPVQSDSSQRTCFYSEPYSRSTWSMKDELLEHILASDIDSLNHLACLNGSDLLPEDPFLTSLELLNTDFCDCSNSELSTDYSPDLYDGLLFM
ncbi:hypothetical protein ACET3Z_025189 [Daucus carota]